MNTEKNARFALEDQLTGVLIALARAAENETPPASAHRAMLSGLAYEFAAGDAGSLERAVAAVRAEKSRLAPMCAACTAACGRTAEYGLRDLLAEPDARTRALKLSLLFTLQGLARCVRAARPDSLPQQETLAFFYRSLFALGYPFSPQQLQALSEEGGQLALQQLE